MVQTPFSTGTLWPFLENWPTLKKFQKSLRKKQTSTRITLISFFDLILMLFLPTTGIFLFIPEGDFTMSRLVQNSRNFFLLLDVCVHNARVIVPARWHHVFV